jgi:hypothetical protein
MVLDWVPYNVVVERDEYAPDPAVVVATAPSIDLAAHIAELHNSWLDASGRASRSRSDVRQRCGDRAARRRESNRMACLEGASNLAGWAR